MVDIVNHASTRIAGVPDPDPTFYFDDDPDPDPTPSFSHIKKITIFFKFCSHQCQSQLFYLSSAS
jgi:hypothetical protein